MDAHARMHYTHTHTMQGFTSSGGHCTTSSTHKEPIGITSYPETLARVLVDVIVCLPTCLQTTGYFLASNLGTGFYSIVDDNLI